MKAKTKTREPYGKVTEVGQVPVALQEIRELSLIGASLPNSEVAAKTTNLHCIKLIADSIIAVTCSNPGCLSQMAEAREVQK